jgi:glutaredoxin-related protein
MEGYKSPVVAEVRDAIAAHKIVVVGMMWNPHVPRARKTLEKAGLTYHYLGYGSYVSQWKNRLGIKLWSGWPTFPQVFVDGRLIGGASELKRAIEAGDIGAEVN